MPTEIVDDPQDNEGYIWKKGKHPICLSSEHNPPSMIVIPPGKKMIHTCPVCGKVTVVHGRIVFGVNMLCK